LADRLAYLSRVRGGPILMVVAHILSSGDIANPATMNKDGGKSPLAVLRENMTVIAASRAAHAGVTSGSRTAESKTPSQWKDGPV
jgi:hypothetical protein